MKTTRQNCRSAWLLIALGFLSTFMLSVEQSRAETLNLTLDADPIEVDSNFQQAQTPVKPDPKPLAPESNLAKCCKEAGGRIVMGSILEMCSLTNPEAVRKFEECRSKP